MVRQGESAPVKDQLPIVDALPGDPIVPEGSTAHLRVGGASAPLGAGWFDGKTVQYFTFAERARSGSLVPVSPIVVSFNKNPGTDGGYSPLWQVSVYDNTAFDQVHDLATLH